MTTLIFVKGLEIKLPKSVETKSLMMKGEKKREMWWIHILPSTKKKLTTSMLGKRKPAIMSTYICLTFIQKRRNKIKWLNLTRILSFPWKMEPTISINLLRWSEHSKSHTEPVTLSPLFFHSSKHLSISSWLRAHIWTVAPNSANSSTMACLIQKRKI